MILATLAAPTTRAHDIPNARVDRASQVTLTPGQLRIDYEVSLSELTLTQELRSLIGHLPGSGREDWLSTYGQETGPLNARGFLVHVDGAELPLRAGGFDLLVEEHPRYIFHLTADLPERGRLTIQDANFTSSEGTSRLALRGVGVEVTGSHLPTNVSTIAPRPVWQLTDQEERDTRYVAVEFAAIAAAHQDPPPREPPASTPAATTPGKGLAGLFEEGMSGSWVLLAMLAVGLGAVHGLLPGHGKTLMAAAVLGDAGGWHRVLVLALVTTIAHMGAVFLIAAGFWWTASTQFEAWNSAIGRTAGFVIAAVGVWRTGRWLGGISMREHDHGFTRPATLGGLVALGIAGGAIPCWDAIALVLFAEAVGRLGLALLLVLAFSIGLGVVLTGVGLAAARMRLGPARRWTSSLRALSNLALSALGLYLLYRPG